MPLKGKYLVWAITGTSRYLVLRGVDHDQRDTLVACCCQGFLLLGYDQGVMSGIVSTLAPYGATLNSNAVTLVGS